VIRNFGVGLSMMPIMTAGVAALTAAQVSAGSALNNVAQRVSASLGLAVFGGLLTAQQAQLMADRSSLIATGPNALPEVAAAQEQGPAGMYAMYQQLQQAVITTSYANMFLVVTWLCLVAVALAFLLRHGAARPASAAPPAPPEEAAPAAPSPRPDRTEVHA
jgi:hypothetical protein